MEQERRVEKFISQHHLLNSGAQVLVAVSGGADSVALLHILIRLGYKCQAVHCNFHLRGEESNRDEQFVTELCHTMNIRLEVVHFDTESYAAQHHLSIETAARELRYREFESIRQAKQLDCIAVAHHQDDAVETLLLNLIRGAGINGLTGIHARNGYVVRPLLCLNRDEVIAYLSKLGQAYVTDSTNLTDEYARNKIRLSLLPLMQEINPCATANIAQAATHLADAAIIYNKAIKENNHRIVSQHAHGVDINIASLLNTDIPQAQLFEILYPYGFRSRQVADIFRSLENHAGPQFHAPGYILLRDRTHLLLRRKGTTAEKATDRIYELPESGIMEMPDGTTLTIRHIKPDASWQIPQSANICTIDASRIKTTLTIRHPKEGDRFYPFGMKGSKLLSDFYTDLKIPRTEKSQQWLLCNGDDIIWAIGKRSSERYRLKGDENDIVEIRLGHLPTP